MSRMILTDWEDDELKNLHLLLVNTTLEGYRFAYMLNKKSPSHSFSALQNDLIVNTKQVQNQFACYHSYDSESTTGIFCVENHAYNSTGNASFGGLFESETPALGILLSRFSRWDYILICGEKPPLQALKNTLYSKEIAALQSVDFKLLKEGERAALTNLIYENER